MSKLLALRFWKDPYFVMGIVLFMYAIKVVGKITVGEMINSPMISGDGFHNISDLFEAMAVMVVVFLVRRKPNSSYPFGLKQMEYLTSFLIGGALSLVAVNFALDSIVGILAQFGGLDQSARELIPFLPDYQPLIMSTAALPYILAVTAGSALFSLVVSRYQIFVGKDTGHLSLVADGQETWSDGRIELVVLAGVLAEYLFHAAWIEYPLGLYVSFLVFKTAWSLIKTGWCALLLRTIGEEHEEHIKQICLRAHGVLAIEKLKSFQVGPSAVVILILEARAEHCKAQHIKFGIESAIHAYLTEEGFKGSELEIRFSSPDPRRHRIAFAVRQLKGQLVVADHMQDATHLLVCDMEHERIVRTKLIDREEAPLVVLKSKRVSFVYLFKPGAEDGWLRERTEVRESPSNLLSVMGVPN